MDGSIGSHEQKDGVAFVCPQTFSGVDILISCWCVDDDVLEFVTNTNTPPTTAQLPSDVIITSSLPKMNGRPRHMG